MSKFVPIAIVVELPDDAEVPDQEAIHAVLVSTGGTVIDHSSTVMDDYEDAAVWIGEVMA